MSSTGCMQDTMHTARPPHHGVMGMLSAGERRTCKVFMHAGC